MEEDEEVAVETDRKVEVGAENEVEMDQDV